MTDFLTALHAAAYCLVNLARWALTIAAAGFVITFAPWAVFVVISAPFRRPRENPHLRNTRADSERLHARARRAAERRAS